MKKKLSSLISYFSSRNGFTLVELLVIIAVIGVLATALFALVNPLAQFQKSRDGERKSDLAQIQRALEQYYNDNNAYPAGSPNYYLDATHAWNDTWTPYMDVIPKDPTSSQRYIYVSTGQTYSIYAHLERGGQDSQACNVSGNDCSNAPASNKCNSTNTLSCNYGVTSPNISP